MIQIAPTPSAFEGAVDRGKRALVDVENMFVFFFVSIFSVLLCSNVRKCYLKR